MWAGGVRVIIKDSENRILMVCQRHEGKPIWMVPGGGIEANETSRDAVIREVKEETGLDVEVGVMVWHVERITDEGEQRFVNYFTAKVTGGEAKLGIDPELSSNEQVLEDMRYMSKEELNKIEYLYPDYLKEELWHYYEHDFTDYDGYKIRK